MSALALFLVLLAAILHATWNYHLKKAARGATLWWMVYWISSLILMPALLLWDPDALSNVTPTGWLVIGLSAPIHTLYAIVLQTGYRKADYSIVYPTARGAGPLITVLAAVLFLDNQPSILGWFGIAAILGGVVFLTLRPGTANKQSSVKTGVFWGLLTGCCIAAYSFCDAWAVQQATGLTPASFYFPSLLIRAVIMTPLIVFKNDWQKEVRDILHDPVARKSLAIVAFGSPGAYMLVLSAMTMAPLAYVAPTREVGMMIGVFVGALLLKETFSIWRITGILSMVLGVLLIAFAH